MENQEILERDEQKMPSSSGIVGWLVAIIIMAVLLAGGYWYYRNYIVKKDLQPAPSPEVTEAVWKTKSEKVSSDFLNYWQSATGSQSNELSRKARDLLTLKTQAELETFKDSNNQPLGNLVDKLNALMKVTTQSKSFEITSSDKIDETTVEISVKLSYDKERANRVFKVVMQDNIWLIDEVKIGINDPSPVSSPSVNISPSISPSSASPRISPSP